MSVGILILKILGYTLLGVLGLILVVLFIPVAADIHLRGSRLSVTIRYLFYRKKVFDSSMKKAASGVEKTDQTLSDLEQDKSSSATPPSIDGDRSAEKGGASSALQSVAKDDKHVRKKKRIKKAKNKDEGKSKNGNRKFRFDLSFILDLLDPASVTLRYIFRRLVIRHICIALIADGDDPSEVGYRTGKMWASIGVITGYLNTVCRHIQYEEIHVTPNFASLTDEEKISCQIIVMPYIIVVALVYLFLRAIGPIGRNTERNTEREDEQRNEARRAG